jgi:hypothetical protein
MTARVDKLETDVSHLKKLGWATLLCAATGLILRILQLLHLAPAGFTAPPLPVPGGNNNAVHIGATPTPDDSRKTFLTTADVATRENIAERTVLEWIEQNRLAPAPEKSGRSWVIPVHYRILP